ncbi:MAG: TIR domain-containing protein [Prevotella sp.]|nr:TIR domain-containing protein [Prevotella sp.]
MKKKVLVCFDFEKDKHYKYLMNAWDANDNFELSFNDVTPSEIQSNNIPVIKANLIKKINQADITVVLVGVDATKKHKDQKSIGFDNWQIFEIEQSKANGNKLVVVKLDKSNKVPSACYGCGARFVNSFNEEDIVDAIENV